MNKKIRWMTETAMMLALLVTLQWITKPLNQQLITGTCVNAVLAVTVLVAGFSSGITVALISPVMAYLLKIAPQILTVPVIMVGNTLFVMVLYLLVGKDNALVKRIIAWIAAAAVKFGVMFALVSWGICGVLAPTLLAAGTLKEPMLKALPVTFGVTQLFTALLGGGVALVIVPAIRKALKR